MKPKHLAVFSLAAASTVLTLGPALDAQAPGRAGRSDAPAGIRDMPCGPLVPGADTQRCDHGHRMIDDGQGFRKVGPWPVKTGPRIVALGDSLTYGEGVAFEDAWPAVLGRLTGVEVLNLGRRGAQAIDVAELALRMYEARSPVSTPGLPAVWAAPPTLTSGRLATPAERGLDLDPDLIVYGVYLNDCGPSWTQENLYDVRWWDVYGIAQLLAPPTQARGARYALKHFRRQCWDAFEALARLPVRTIVVPLFMPGWDGRTELNEIMTLARSSGLEVLGDDYLDDFAGDDWRVSPWQWHPRERAHRVYAEVIHEAIRW